MLFGNRNQIPVEALVEIENQKDSLVDNVEAKLFGRTVNVGIERAPFYRFKTYVVYWREDNINSSETKNIEILSSNPLPLYKKQLEKLKDEVVDDVKTYGTEADKPWYGWLLCWKQY